MATKRALIVDDSKTAQYRLKKLLRGYQLDIVAVDSAEAALSYLASSVPDVVFMDHLMPGMDGFRALQIIKSHPATATVPVIMYTSKSGDLYTSEARALGALDVVSKESITAADLRQVLKAIRIYPQDADNDQPGAEKNTKTPTAEPAAHQATESPAPEAMLSVELRLRELEHSIDDNRRIITSRLVREIQGIHHHVRKLAEQMSEIKNQKAYKRESEREQEALEVTQSPPENSQLGSRWWAKLALFVMALFLGHEVYLWGSEMSEQLIQIENTQQSIIEHTDQLTEQIFADVNKTDKLYAPVPEQSDQLALLPDLAWALNQNSVQGFHPTLVDPKLTQQLTELASRLFDRNFQGKVRVAVQGGDFCVVTNLSGEPQLPEPDSKMEDCMLISELYGADATEQATEQLRFALTESALLDNQQIDLDIEPFRKNFAPYPEFHPQTSAQEWNQAARANNRVFINIKPAVASTRAVQRNRTPQ